MHNNISLCLSINHFVSFSQAKKKLTAGKKVCFNLLSIMVSIFWTLSVITLGTLSAFLIVFLVCVLLLWHQHRRYDHLPGPKRTSFFCGNISDLTEAEGRLWCDVCLNYALVYGPVFVWWHFYSPVVVISSPELIKHGLISLNLPKGPASYNRVAYLFGRYRFLGSGLLSQVDHERWKEQRLWVNPAFHRGYLKDLVPQFNAAADALVARLMKLADGKTVINMADEFQKATLGAIAKVVRELHYPNPLIIHEQEKIKRKSPP